MATCLSALATFAGCRATPVQPSILLVVLDTVRADDVSSYGRVVGTTPTVDALARSGLRYAHAYANANWTLPAHASLFTGLLPHQHGARTVVDALPDTIPTLAERLQAAGYETMGISENPVISDRTRMTRGFGRFKFLWTFGSDPTGPDMSDIVGEWMEKRPRERPYFLFLNIMDAHLEYKVRTVNSFLPEGTTAEAARRVSQTTADYLCWKRAGHPDLAILRGLYRGDVQAADAKLGRVIARVPERPVTIVVSDHGEAFGEKGLFGHGIGLANVVLHVPLIVSGLPNVAPGVIESAVQVADVFPSVLSWAGAPPLDGIAGRALPLREPSRETSRPIVSEYTDTLDEARLPDAIRDHFQSARARCGAQDRVFGDMRSIISFPDKLVAYAKYSPELFELRNDPREDHDLSAASPNRVAQLQQMLSEIIAARGPATSAPTAPLDPASAERLRALGYLGDAPAGAP